MRPHEPKLSRRLLTWAAVLPVVSIAGSALAVDLRGSVRLRGDAKEPQISAPRGAYVREWNGFIEPKKRTIEVPREVTAVLIGTESMKDATTVLLKNGQLFPRTIVMQQGTSLRVRNEDDFTHQLSATGLKSFDSVETSAAQGRQIQVDEAGTFEIRDALAPHVTGTLVVLPKVSAVATMNEDGSFTFADVPAGNYVLKLFHAGKEVSSVNIELSEGREVTLDPIDIPVASK